MSPVINDVEAALPDEFESVSQIHGRLNMWARHTVRHALNKLCVEGKATRELVFKTRKEGAYFYRRVRT